MTYEEFEKVMTEKNVRHNRVNGFHLIFFASFVRLEGRIPLSLARRICEGIDNSKLQIRVQGGDYTCSPDDYATNAELTDIIDDMLDSKLFEPDDFDNVCKNYIKDLEAKNQLDDIYITMYRIDTAEGLRHVIDCIDEGNYENKCLFK